MSEDEAYDAHVRGCDLMVRGGHAREAERLLRHAIAGERPEAADDLGQLLSLQPRRRGEEEDAYRIATTAQRDPRRAADAALRLGWLLERQGRLDEARAWLEHAEASGDDFAQPWARKDLGMLLAYTGDTTAARERVRAFAEWYFTQREVQMSSRSLDCFAAAMVEVGAGRLTRSAWRRSRLWRGAAHRRLAWLIARSTRATSAHASIARAKDHAIAHFYGTVTA